jgi:hypothetical protein
MIKRYEEYFTYLYHDMGTPIEKREKIKSFFFYKRLIDQRNVIAIFSRDPEPEFVYTSQQARDYYNLVLNSPDLLRTHTTLTDIENL